MYLRLLSLPAKLKYEGFAIENKVDELPLHTSFVGCYAKLTATLFSPHEREGEDGYYDKFLQLFNVYCAEHILATLLEAHEVGVHTLSSEARQIITTEFASLLLPNGSNVTDITELALLLRRERRVIRNQLNTGPLVSDERSQPDILWEIAAVVASTPDFQGQRVYLLLDEFDSLSEQEQRAINSYLRKRDYPLTFKIACKKHRLTLEDRLGNPLNPSGDFSRVELDDDDFGRSGTFSHYLEAIANKRLQHAGIGVNIKTLLGPGSPSGGPKAERTYSGFNTVAMLSSGIVRSFIELCRDLYPFATHNGTGGISTIPVSDQDRVIKNHGSNKWNVLSRDHSARAELQHLISQIATLFEIKSRTTNESKIIRIEIIDFDRASPFLRLLLDQALEFEALVQPNRERLQKNRRATSRGYLLHRLLCIHFRLPPESRWDCEISCDQLERMALGTPDDVRAVVKQPTKQIRNRSQQGRPANLLENWKCPVLDSDCPRADPAKHEGFLSCRLSQSGKIRDAIKFLKNEFSRCRVGDTPYRLRTAEDFPSQGDIACKVCAAVTECRFTLVELSGFSPSVCMELGLAIARSVPTFILFNSEEQTEVPEPFSSLEYYRYSITPADIQRLVQQKIVPHLPGLGAAKRNIRIGPENPPLTEECDGVFVALPGAPYYQETLLPAIRELAVELELGPVRTEQEGQAIQDLHRATVNIAKSRLALIDTTFGASTRAMYLGMAQGYRKPFLNLVEAGKDSEKRVFTNAKSKCEVTYKGGSSGRSTAIDRKPRGPASGVRRGIPDRIIRYAL